MRVRRDSSIKEVEKGREIESGGTGQDRIAERTRDTRKWEHSQTDFQPVGKSLNQLDLNRWRRIKRARPTCLHAACVYYANWYLSAIVSRTVADSYLHYRQFLP